MDVRKVNGVPSSVLHDGNSDDDTLFSNVGTDTLYSDGGEDRPNLCRNGVYVVGNVGNVIKDDLERVVS